MVEIEETEAAADGTAGSFLGLAYPKGFKTEAIIDPFVRLLKKALFSLGFCCESIDCSSHNESTKHAAFGIFNSSSCAPIKSRGTSLYCESDSVPAITVHFFPTSFCLDRCLSQRQSRTQEVRETEVRASRILAA